MIHIFHGEHTEASRAELVKLKEKLVNAQVISFDGKTVPLAELIQATDSPGLFGGAQLIIIENFLSRRITKKSAELVQIEAWIKSIAKEIDAIFWEDKELPKSTLSLFPKHVDIALFKLDRLVFSFTESVYKGNARKALGIFNQARVQESTELLFAMLVRQMRLLIMAKDLGKEALGLPPWQASKLLKQAQFYTLQELIVRYQELALIDYRIKSGQSAQNLAEALGVWLAEL